MTLEAVKARTIPRERILKMMLERPLKLILKRQQKVQIKWLKVLIKKKNSLESSSSKSTISPNKTDPTDIPNENQQSEVVAKIMSDKNDLNLPKTQTPFSIENEISKIKISIPLIELVGQDVYRYQVLKALNIGENTNTVNLNDDKPEILFGPEVEGKFQEGGVPPFYVSLNIHDKILHNSMLDSGASHNLMPKVIMEKLGLEITIPYKDL